MNRRQFGISVLAALAIGALNGGIVQARPDVKNIHGKIRLVTIPGTENYRVRVVTIAGQEDLRVRKVDVPIDGVGVWQMVTIAGQEDFRILLVDIPGQEDFCIRYVDIPGEEGV